MDPSTYATYVAAFFDSFLPQACLIGEFAEWAADASREKNPEPKISFPDERLEFGLYNRSRFGTILYDDMPDHSIGIALVRDGAGWAVASVWVLDRLDQGLMAAARRAFGHSILQPEESDDPSLDLAEWVLQNQNTLRPTVH